MAKPTVVTINPYEAAEGVKYALPIRVSSDGSIQEERQGTKYILLLDKPWSQFTPYLNSTVKVLRTTKDSLPSSTSRKTPGHTWLWYMTRLNVISTQMAKKYRK